MERCDCDCATPCPLGKTGMAQRCTLEELRKHQEAQELLKQLENANGVNEASPFPPMEKPMSEINKFLHVQTNHEVAIPLEAAVAVAKQLPGHAGRDLGCRAFLQTVKKASTQASRDFSFPDPETIPLPFKRNRYLENNQRHAVLTALRGYMRSTPESRITILVASLITYVESNKPGHFYFDELEMQIINRCVVGLRGCDSDEARLVTATLGRTFEV